MANEVRKLHNYHVNPVATLPAVPLCLLGSARWLEQQIPPSPMLWLLTYLASSETWVNRSEIAVLLWADVSESDARNNLRQLLHRSKNLEWAGAFEGNAKTLRLIVPSDVTTFKTAIRQADWQKALTVYGGALLEGILTPNAFEAWLEAERAALHEDWRTALIGRIQELEANPDSSLPNLLVQLLGIDPYNEEALHGLLNHATVLGSRQEALRQFELFQARLRSDLGVEPQPQTLALVATLKGQVLPVTNLRFVGRQAEQAEIHAQFEAGTRLIMLRGLGGIGKTTLAKEILEQHKNLFSTAIWLTLRDINKVDNVPLAVAAGLGLNLQANTSPWLQIAEFFKARQTLLVLDNLEHLSGIAEPLTTWLESAPQLTLLLTSRVSLNIPDEWVLTLEGLAYPPSPNLEAARTASAVQLFVARAARRRGGFTLNEKTLPGILRICQLVQGLPLGLELAAAWMGDLSLETLAEGLEANAEWLEVNEPEIPETHQSLRTVFEHSWELLEDDLRQTLCAISLFQGGFDRPAALEGMGVSARSLLGLVARSLLQQTGRRYEPHPMVQAFARQKLEPTDLKNWQHKHALYFAQFAKQAEQFLRQGANQSRTLKQIAANYRNYISALDWTILHSVQLGAQIVGNLVHFWYSGGHRREGRLWATQFLLHYNNQDAVRLSLLWTKASLGSELGEYDQTTQTLNEYDQLAGYLENSAALGPSTMLRGILARSHGTLEEAKTHLHDAAKILETNADQNRLGNCLNHLAGVYQMQNDLVTAKKLYEQSLNLKRLIQDQQGIAYALSNLGGLAGDEGNYQHQHLLLEESLKLTEELGDEFLKGWILQTLGINALNTHQLARAQQYSLEALEIFMRLERRNSAITLIFGFAEIADTFLSHNDAIIIGAAAIQLWEQLGAAPRLAWQQKHQERLDKSRLAAATLQQLELQGQRFSLSDTAVFVQNSAALWLEPETTV